MVIIRRDGAGVERGKRVYRSLYAFERAPRLLNSLLPAPNCRISVVVVFANSAMWVDLGGPVLYPKIE